MAIDNEVERRFNAHMNMHMAGIETEMLLSVTEGVVEEINVSSGFSNFQAQEAIDRITNLYDRFVNIPNDASAEVRDRSLQVRSDVTLMFNDLVLSFASAGRTDLITELVEDVPLLSQGNAVLAPTLTQVLGLELVGAAGGASTWDASSDVNRETYERYRANVAAAGTAGYPELLVLYEGIVRMMEGAPEEEIGELVDGIDTLYNNDRTNFDRILRDLVTEDYTNAPDAESARVAQRARAFVERFADRSETLAAIASDLPAQD